MDHLGIPYRSCHSVGTIIHMAVNGQYAGHIVISDIVKPRAKEAVRMLKRAGVRKTVMLTGDAKKVQIRWQKTWELIQCTANCFLRIK